MTAILIDVTAGELNLSNACPGGNPKGNDRCFPVVPKVAHCPVMADLSATLSLEGFVEDWNVVVELSVESEA